jgi:beta-lactam-binding protein with PASTA domain
VREKTLAQAKRVIHARRCRLGGVRRAWSSSLRKGRVLRQVPRAGRTLQAGAKVAFVVSKGRR